MGLAIMLLLSLTAATSPSARKKLEITPEQAVSTALQHNLSLKIERLAPELSDAPEKAAKGAFDPVAFGEMEVGGEAASPDGPEPISPSIDARGSAGVRKTFITGTELEVRLSATLTRSYEAGQPGRNAYTEGGAVTLRQPLLRGAGRTVNESGIVTARLARSAAERKLRRKAELLAADTLVAYWDLYGAASQLRVHEVGLEQAKKTLAETTALVAAGKVAAVEEVAARYQVQVQRRAVVLAEKEVGNARDRLGQLLGLLRAGKSSNVDIRTKARPVTDTPRADLSALEKLALQRRGDLEALTEEVEAKKLSARVAADLLLPRLDLTASVGVARFDGRLSAPSHTKAVEPGSTELTWAVGLTLEIPLSKNEAEAARERADLALRKAKLTVERSKQIVVQEVRMAWRNVRSAWETLELTRSAVELAELKFQNERKLFRAGKSTARILTMVQAELLQERAKLQDAVAAFNKALVALRSASGTLVAEVDARV